MKSFRARYLRRTSQPAPSEPIEEGNIMQQGPATATQLHVQQSNALPIHRDNRRQRRRRDAFNRQLNHQLKTMSSQGLPVKMSIGADGRPVVRVDLRAAKRAEEAKLAQLAQLAQDAALVEHEEYMGIDRSDPTGDYSSETVFDADGKVVSHRILAEGEKFEDDGLEG